MFPSFLPVEREASVREITLPSGAILKVNAAPFLDSKALYQALLAETKSIPFIGKNDLGETLKNLFCAAFSSPAVDRALSKCMDRCMVGALKIDGDTFEPAERRQDYVVVCSEVARENVGPFLKSLFADYQKAMSILDGNQGSSSKTTPTT